MAPLKVTATFETSAARAADCPRDGLPEIALVGRSNVGKSSLINALVGHRVARTSATPGKTQLVNFYRVQYRGTACYLSDLPGFGYVRAGRQARAGFDAITAEYFSRTRRHAERAGPDGVLLLIDARHPGLDSDRTAQRWLNELSMPTTVVATKIDKLTRAERPRTVQRIQAAMDAPVVPVSTVTGEGLKELWTQILAHTRPAA